MLDPVRLLFKAPFCIFKPAFDRHSLGKQPQQGGSILHEPLHVTRLIPQSSPAADVLLTYAGWPDCCC